MVFMVYFLFLQYKERKRHFNTLDCLFCFPTSLWLGGIRIQLMFALASVVRGN